MADGYVRPVGTVQDIDGMDVTIGVDFDTVTIAAAGTPIRFDAAQAEAFAALFVAACWQAARQAERMAQEAQT